jgi:L-serine deaminase
MLAHIAGDEKVCKNGIKNEDILLDGLKVTRHTPKLYRLLQNENSTDPMQAIDWVNLFALAVSEENAAGGKVVTAQLMVLQVSSQLCCITLTNLCVQ